MAEMRAGSEPTESVPASSRSPLSNRGGAFVQTGTWSPTTMYNDYSISETLFHWQSQSTTSDDSSTGQRYINHVERGSRILLFVRESKKDAVMGSAATYTYLGTANYVSHEGSRPMNVTCKLDRPILAKYLKKTNKLVVG